MYIHTYTHIKIILYLLLVCFVCVTCVKLCLHYLCNYVYCYVFVLLLSFQSCCSPLGAHFVTAIRIDARLLASTIIIMLIISCKTLNNNNNNNDNDTDEIIMIIISFNISIINYKIRYIRRLAAFRLLTSSSTRLRRRISSSLSSVMCVYHYVYIYIERERYYVYISIYI